MKILWKGHKILEEVIRKIISIENDAQRIMDLVEKEKQDKRVALQNELKQMQEKLVRDANHKVEEIKHMELKLLKEEANEMLKDCQRKINSMQELYDKNSDQWVDEIVQSVLKR